MTYMYPPPHGSRQSLHYTYKTIALPEHLLLLLLRKSHTKFTDVGQAGHVLTRYARQSKLLPGPSAFAYNCVGRGGRGVGGVRVSSYG